MAAAEFYATGAPLPNPRPSAAYLAPQPPQRSSSHPNVNFNPQHFAQTSPSQNPGYRPNQPQYPIFNEPKPNLHFGPAPTPPQRSSFSGQQRPQYLQPPPHQYGPPAPYNQSPYIHRNHSDSALGNYATDREVHSRHSKHRSNSRDGKKGERRISETSRSTRIDGLIGATSGGLIGDFLFPGLGTVGGAVIGYIGGKDYGEHRKYKEMKRGSEQEHWDRKWSRDASRDRSRGSHHSDDRRKSTDHDRHVDDRRHSGDDRKHSGDRRQSHDRRRNEY